MPALQLMIHLRTSINIFFLAGCLFIASCSLDNPEPQPTEHSINLQAVQEYSLTELKWNPVKVTGFKEYIILQSTEPIPTTPAPVINANVTVLKRIDDSDITTFFASDILFTPRICYKLFVAIDERFIQSGNVCVDQDFQLFEGFYDRAGHGEDTDEIIMFDRVNSRFSIYDLTDEAITKSVTDIVLNFPIIEVSTFEGTTNVFAYDQSPPRLRKYRYPELTSTQYKDFNGVLFAAAVNDQYIYTAVEENGKAFQVISRNNFSVVDFKPGLLGSRNIAVFPGNPLTVLEISETNIIKYSIDNNGKAVVLATINHGIIQPSTQNTTANSDNLFIGGRLGTILDKEGNVLGALGPAINSFVIISRITPDEKTVAYIINDNVSFRLEVADISNPADILKKATFSLPSANYADLVIKDDLMYVAGVSFSSGDAQSFILKYPMP